MKSLSFAFKKRVVNEFHSLLKDKLLGSYFNLDTLHYLSKRKVYKLLKLSFESEGKKFDKKTLKDIALLLSKVNFNSLSKSDVKNIYKILLKRDIYFLINDMIGNIYFIFFNLIQFREKNETKSSNFILEIFKQMRILII
ncbi:MAG: hypothetical protein HRT99_00280 [Mycoplasmatales bacterium]|nr:hypothetical protein [Mycoplasmatales bacterium]